MNAASLLERRVFHMTPSRKPPGFILLRLDNTPFPSSYIVCMMFLYLFCTLTNAFQVETGQFLIVLVSSPAWIKAFTSTSKYFAAPHKRPWSFPFLSFRTPVFILSFYRTQWSLSTPLPLLHFGGGLSEPSKRLNISLNKSFHWIDSSN